MAFMAQVIGFKNVSGTVYVQGQHVGHTGVSGATATETNGMIIFNFLHVYYSPHWFDHWVSEKLNSSNILFVTEDLWSMLLSW